MKTKEKTKAIRKSMKDLGKQPDKMEEGKNDSWLMQRIKRIVQTVTKTPTKAPFIFENSLKAARKNFEILERDNFQFSEQVFPKGSVVSPGYEFRPIDELQPLLYKHMDWEKVKNLISNGARYPIPSTSLPLEETRLSDLKAAIKRGNNKSSLFPEENRKEVTKAYDKETNYNLA